MHLEDKDFLKLIRLTKEQFPEEKKERVDLLIQVYVETIMRCPCIAKIPLNEKMELIQILKEKDIL